MSLLLLLWFGNLHAQLSSAANKHLRPDTLVGMNEKELYEYGRFLLREGDQISALHVFLKILFSFSETHYQENHSRIDFEKSKIFADASTHTGIIYFSKGDFPKSLEHFYNALKIYQTIEHWNGVGNLLNNAGTVYFEWGEYELALGYFLDAQQIFTKHNIENKQTMMLNNIGGVYFRLEQYVESINFFRLSLQASKAEGIDYLFNQYYNIGYAYLKLGDFDNARRYLLDALNIAENQDNTKDIAMAYVRLSSVYIARNSYQIAEIYLNNALAIALEQDLLEEQMEIYRTWSELMEKKSDYKGALGYFKSFFQIQDTLFNAEKHAQIRELQILYETEKKEKELQLLSLEQVYKAAQIASQRRWIKLLSAGLFSISVLLVIVFIQKRRQARANLDLVKKNLEILESEKRFFSRVAGKDLYAESFNGHAIAPDGKTVAAEIDPVGSWDPMESTSQPHSAGKYQSSTLTNDQKESILDAVTAAMEQDFLYRDPNLTLDQISDRIGTNRAYVSQVVNEATGESFISFVNNYRIREARRLLADEKYDNLTIEAIAHHVGFNSKSSFNTFFKKITGITPSYFQKNAKNAQDV
ncbi:MAG: tetratricopeptide repeat protein [Bacteroidales bacterium]